MKPDSVSGNNYGIITQVVRLFLQLQDGSFGVLDITATQLQHLFRNLVNYESVMLSNQFIDIRSDVLDFTRYSHKGLTCEKLFHSL